MCYNFKTSLLSYSIGIISVIFAIMTRQFAVGLLILAYCQIQLSELLIWHGIDTNNEDLNRLGTSYGKYLLATHNIAFSVGIILSIIFISKKNLKLTDFIPLVISILFFMYVIFFIYLPKNYPDITLPLDPNCNDKDKCQNPDNRLEWKYPTIWYLFSYVICMLIVIGYIKPINSKICITAFFTLTLIFSAILKPKNVGTIWCFSSAILAPVLVTVNYYLIKNLNSSDIIT